LFSNLIPKYPEIEHLHTTPDKWFEKLMLHIKPVVADLMVLFKVLWMPNGDRSFNRNMPTEKLLSYFTAQKKRQI
jgi:hydroxymethylglutaryl-CoA lyase